MRLTKRSHVSLRGACCKGWRGPRHTVMYTLLCEGMFACKMLYVSPSGLPAGYFCLDEKVNSFDITDDLYCLDTLKTNFGII